MTGYLQRLLVGLALSALLWLPRGALAHDRDDAGAEFEGVIPGTELLATVEHGRNEPRSIGSYTLRLYRIVHADWPYDAFVTGLVRERDGAVERLAFPDLDGDGAPDIVVVIRSAGSGGYLFADAYAGREAGLEPLGAVAWLPATADPIAALRDIVTRPDEN
ncbi:MAG: hypothetical protein F4Y02_05460 [Chloroflexi bacterium]|nr:hypothetical protein [Chloroflexota bacterium]